MEKGNSNKDPIEEYKGTSWSTIRSHYWKAQANDPNSQWYRNKDALQGKAPTKNGQKIVLHHPNGRKGSNIEKFEEMPEDEHRDFHKEYGYHYDEENGWH